MARIAIHPRRLLQVRDRSLEITRAGWLFIALTLAVGFAAINSGSNLLHAIFGAQMALIVGSGLVSEAIVRRVVVRRIVPHGVYAQTPATLRLDLRNTNGEADLISLSVEDARGEVTAPRGSCRPVFLLRLPAGSERTIHTLVTMPCRGLHPLPRAVVSTRFPFGLFVKSRALPETQPILVFPKVHPIAAEALQHQAAAEGPTGESLARAGEFRELRDYHDGDDPRRIHWRASARLGKPVVRELEAGHSPTFWLDVAGGHSGEPRFERHIEEVASLSAAYLREPGWSVGLRHAGHTVIPPGSGEAHRHRILEFLARCGEPADCTAAR